MARQTSVSAPAKAFAGQRSRNSAADQIDSFALEGSGHSQGSPVLRGTDKDTQVVAVTNGATVDAATFVGFVVLNDARQEGALVAGEVVPVLRKGRIFVTVSDTVTAGMPVYIGNATAQLGQVAGATGTGLTLVPNARFVEGAAASGLALVELS